MLFFLFLLFFFFLPIKLESRRAEQVLRGVGGWHHWEREGGRERGRRVNRVQKMCTHVVNAKMIPVKTVPGMGQGVNLNMVYLIH
jgi:hypothetical protein